MTAHTDRASGGVSGFDNDELGDRQNRHVQVGPTRLEKVLERSAGIDEMPLADDHEQQVIIRALAVGYSVAKMMAWVLAFIFLASGLWWAGIVVYLAMTIPGIVANHYARRRGVDLFWQSGLARNELSVAGLFGEIIMFTLLVGLIALPAALGHPLIPSGWATVFPKFDETLIWVFGGLIVGSCFSWICRRRKLKRKLREQCD
ncbi:MULTISPECIES: hypothetical protein [unclassified Brevibacterium]|uniref:hypothetical protein n=1 Tax=unclassified Brevibacterium TaxID=2614124 RepID=UPI0010927758|nr:hypothetical protein [Brevibacterium sp. S22]TGD31828.1 hypothetical protein EB835_07175 [Brevibacterium sp. S22]